MRSLQSLSDKELLCNLNKLVKQEHECTLKILLHLIEVENRKVYRALGYSSMFVYCTEGLGYSESGANRRIYAARAVRKCPRAYEYLRDGCVNLATLALVWQYLTPELLEEIRDKTYRQVQVIVSRFNPMIKHRDITRPVVVRKPVPAPCPPPAISTSNKELGEITLRRGGKKSSTDTPIVDSGLSMNVDISTPPEAEPADAVETVKMHNINCLVDDAVMQDLDRCKKLLSGKYPKGVDFNMLLKELAAEWLNKNDPVERDKRRQSRKKATMPRRNKPDEISRYISPAVRDAVFKRDGGRCTYVGADGKRCSSRWDLEIHHDQVPFGRGGSHSTNNLKLLCAAHNRLEAERVYGIEYTKKYDVIRDPTRRYVVSDGFTPEYSTGTYALSDIGGAFGFS